MAVDNYKYLLESIQGYLSLTVAKRGLTIKEIAELTGYNKTTISKILNQKEKSITPKVLLKILDDLDVSVTVEFENRG
jgi:transcriptional regulator with XRE-family HTH domain